MNRPKSNLIIENGFSLLELLIVLALISIILTLSLSSQANLISDANQLTASQQFLRVISLARSKSEAYGEVVSICPSSNGQSCGGGWGEGQLVFVDVKHDGLVANRDYLVAVFESLKNGRVYWRSSLGRPYLQWMPNGQTDGEDGTFWYCAKRAKSPSWAIRVSQSGRVRVEFAGQKPGWVGLAC